ncbi:MAG TPA: glycoside hydrolase family 6 protein [Solirubrobacteraceae bacterium]|jgi:endoglucanase|nr:glycoside hydrolase family 6 protein [Solirubrobacteraceae bacterium]
MLVAALAAAAFVSALALATRAQAQPSDTPQCGDPFTATRDASNPLMLPSSPGANPLSGASFFVDGPAHGGAAGAIAQLLGQSLTSFSESEGWAQVQQQLSNLLPSHASVAGQVQELAKIASEPETQRISSYSQGGSATGIYSQTQKLFCHNFLADQGTVPIINTYFLHASLGGCATTSQINAYMPLFQARVNAVAAGTGNRPVVFLLETDGIGSSSCMVRMHSIGTWESAIRYEVQTLGALPHAVTYVEAGYSDSNSPSYTARALRAVDVSSIRGFYTNDTHINWTINEIKWGEKIVKDLHGGHFIVNTAQNGNGPKLNPHPSKQGIEDLCNPPGRALGPKPTTSTGFPDVDAFMWTSIPGNSGGTCNGGTPSGTFWTALGVRLATAANGRLGPHYPNAPY